MENKKLLKISLLILVFSIVIGIVAQIILPILQTGDGHIYEKLAISMIEDHSFPMINDQVHKPGYPVFLAIVYSVFGVNHAVVFFIQSLFVGMIGVMMFYVCFRYLEMDLLFSLLPSFLIILWPYMILYSNLLLAEIVYFLFLYISIFSFLFFIDKLGIKSAIWLGFITSLATLIRPATLFIPFWVIIFIILYLVVFDRGRLKEIYKKYFKLSVVVLLIFILFLSPWIIFASNKSGKFTPVASNGSIAFRKANINFSKEYRIYKTPGYEPGAEFTYKKLAMSKLRNLYRFWKSGAEGYHVDMVIEKVPIAKYLLPIYRIFHYFIILLAFLSLFFVKKNQKYFFYG